jgi:hypothetical protein
MQKPDRHRRFHIPAVVTRNRRRQRASRRGRITLGIAVTALAVIGASGAYAAVSSLAGAQAPSGAQIAATPAGPGRLARAYGLDPNIARVVSTLHDGDTVAVLDGPSARCLIRERAGQTSNEACAPLSELTSARAVTVTDECGSAGSPIMEITGLAPEGATAVRLIDNDGSGRTTAVEDGTFKFDGTNPGPNEPYPTAVEWLTDGQSSGTVLLPVANGQFCLPTS